VQIARPEFSGRDLNERVLRLTNSMSRLFSNGLPQFVFHDHFLPMINVEHLTKTFGPKCAVDDISFSVAKGEVLGFLGPNGAGKSTSMRMITGYLPATSGSITVAGFDIAQHPLEARRRIGYLPENAPIYSDMSVLGFLSFCAEMRGLFGQPKKSAIDRVVQLCFLERVLHQSVDTLSKGFRHRTCLAQALIHDPEVLIMDEPTDGLDPNQKYEVRTLIRRMGAEKAIIFSTHILEEVEAACTRAIIIDQGKIVANGTPAELKAKSPAAGSITITVRNMSSEQLVSQVKALKNAEKYAVLADRDQHVTLRIVPRGNLLPELLETGTRNSWKIEHLDVEEGRLDDVFRSITLPDTKAAA
jgi:ABC-2 type transport system ATP-binding protein